MSAIVLNKILAVQSSNVLNMWYVITKLCLVWDFKVVWILVNQSTHYMPIFERRKTYGLLCRFTKNTEQNLLPFMSKCLI